MQSPMGAAGKATLGCQTSGTKRVQRLPAAGERDISSTPLPPAFAATKGGTGSCAKYRSDSKGAPTATFNSSKNRHPHALTLFQPHPPPPLLLYERQKIRLLDCGEIDWQKKYLRMDIFKRRCLYVGQTRVCGIFHHHRQIFLICYLWILYSWIPLLSWRLFI